MYYCITTLDYCRTKLEIDGQVFILTNKRKEAQRRRMKRKIKDLVVSLILALAVAGVWGYILYDALFIDHGHYEAEFVDENGCLIDIDGDGDVYRWVEP